MRSTLAGILLIFLGMHSTASPFGPAAHAYIALQLFEESHPTALFAATLPDFNGAFRSSPAAESHMKRATHYEFEQLELTPFSAAFATHNNTWGADAIAHAYFVADAPENYMRRKLRELSERSGITMHQAEDLFDAALDMAIARDMGPTLGQQLYTSASASGAGEEEILVRAYAAPLAEATGIPVDDAVLQIRWAVRCMKSVMMAYGNLLQKDMILHRPIAVYGCSRFFGWPQAEANRHLNDALDLAQDWRPALDEIVQGLRSVMLGNSNYAPYLFEVDRLR